MGKFNEYGEATDLEYFLVQQDTGNAFRKVPKAKVAHTFGITGADADKVPMIDGSGNIVWTLTESSVFAVETITEASGAASIVFDTGFTTDAAEYIFALDNVQPVTDNTVLTMDLSTDGGSNWASGYNVVLISTTTGGTSTTTASAGASTINLTNALRNQSNDGFVGKISVIPGTQRNAVIGQGFARAYSGPTDTAFDLKVSMINSSPYRANSVRFKAASGNIKGTIHMTRIRGAGA